MNKKNKQMKTLKMVGAITQLMMAWSVTNAQNLSQTVKGQVVDKESQVSLPGATIVIVGSNPLIGTTTDANGYFSLAKVPVGRLTISVRFLGYQPVDIPEILVNTGKEVILHVELSESVVNLDEAVIKAESRKDVAINSMATVSARTFSIEEAGRYAGGFDDPARMASSFAGVTTGQLEDNSIVVRGNAPKGILWMLEGVPVPNPNHFAGAYSAGGGFMTIFSGQLVANSDFFTGAFPAEYGNALAGAFDIKLRTGNNEKREYWFQAGLLGLDFGAEGPFVKGKNSSYLFNYKYSTYGLISPLLPKGSGLPIYQDLSFKMNFPTKKAGIFSLWGAGAIDKLVKYEEKYSSEWISTQNAEREKIFMMPVSAGLSHKYILGDKSYIHTTLAGTNYSGGHKVGRLDQDLILH
ncbi:MAG: carboxypeptidase-like regulatory domain-containing protein, partial [Bacteroidetes bacterium]|nr:carboxypeptidase-like regulatory domain-containing protein [Bacteroidota bacterium]